MFELKNNRLTTKKSHLNGNIPKDVYVEYVCITTTKRHSFNNFRSAIFIFDINRKKFKSILHFQEDYENPKG